VPFEHVTRIARSSPERPIAAIAAIVMARGVLSISSPARAYS